MHRSFLLDMKGISVLGSTGSIGRNTLQIVDHLKDLRVVALAAGRNVELLAEQCRRYRPELVSVLDADAANALRELLSGEPEMPAIVIGTEGMIEAAVHPQAEIVVSAAVGAAGLEPTLAAVEKGKRVALANKESLVIAGELITNAAVLSGAEILPVDSEHNAIHQCLAGTKNGDLRRLILTASGGPFRTWDKEKIAKASVAEALAHPNWKMGDKISIDSATLMNKGLEVIEAKWLFGVEADRISVIVHPQSVVHSMIELIDGSIIAQMGVTDMRHPIQYALTWPARRENCTEPLSLSKIGSLCFEEPDLARFPCLQLAFDALAAGGTMPAVLNAANEIAVQAFLDQKIAFADIARINADVMAGHTAEPASSLDRVLAADRSARIAAAARIEMPAAA